MMTNQEIISILSLLIDLLSIFLNILIVIGVIAAFWQVKAAKDSMKTEVFLKLYDEWKNPDLYKSMRYIDSLRQEWKSCPVNEWRKLAEEWTIGHVPTNEHKNEKLRNEWMMRRTASQFLSKMGSLVEEGYLSEDDFFGVDPEVGRQLAVLIPIEIAIQNYWSIQEQKHIAEWDTPIPKWEFNALWSRYQKWWKKNKSKYILHPIPWERL